MVIIASSHWNKIPSQNKNIKSPPEAQIAICLCPRCLTPMFFSTPLSLRRMYWIYNKIKRGDLCKTWEINNISLGYAQVKLFYRHSKKREEKKFQTRFILLGLIRIWPEPFLQDRKINNHHQPLHPPEWGTEGRRGEINRRQLQQV